MKSDKLILQEIIKYCENILDDLSFFGNDKENFYEDVRFQHSCAFCLFQIGECTKNLSDSFRQKHPQVSWKEIAGIRDIIGHSYYNIDLDEMWITITRDIPILKRECELFVNQIVE